MLSLCSTDTWLRVIHWCMLRWLNPTSHVIPTTSLRPRERPMVLLGTLSQEVKLMFVLWWFRPYVLILLEEWEERCSKCYWIKKQIESFPIHPLELYFCSTNNEILPAHVCTFHHVCAHHWITCIVTCCCRKIVKLIMDKFFSGKLQTRNKSQPRLNNGNDSVSSRSENWDRLYQGHVCVIQVVKL